MVPTPQEQGSAPSPVAGPAAANRVVISGMAGLYPKSRYITDLENILYNKINPITSDDLRWQYNHPEAAQYAGNVPDLDRFDAQFFKVHFRQSNSMDSMSRKILEQSYEAIYDAGISPTELSGKKVGIFVGSCFSETEKACFYVASSRTGFGISGCNKSMFANRVSYWLNAKGPSMSVDAGCCSSATALEQAYKALASGGCEAAIVGGANLSLHPQSSVHSGRIMKISTDGKTRAFADDANGCAKSEAINVLFLQQAKHAKRIYAEVVYVKSEFVGVLNDETGPKFGFYRHPDHTANFLKNFYREAGVSPGVVEYVEAFGSAVPEADKSELEAIDKVFCNDRKKPLPVGSVMSNIGYGEAASGISAVTKVLLGYHRGKLAGNLHCDTPRQDVAALQEGRMRILTDNEPFQGTYAAVNSLSVTGVNAHVLLQGHYKPRDINRYKSNIPRLVTISGRQDSSVKHILEYFKSQPIDPEQLALLHNIHATSIAGHLGRGYTILDTKEENKTISLTEKAEYFDDVNRPLWFVYSGMGSQWTGMGAQLMRIPIFAAAIERCRQALEPKGIDIINILTSTHKTTFDNILHSFIGIAAVQIGLTDVLFSLGLVPDKIIGHSVGELGCAYADGCVTAEEMILAAYHRGLVSLETPFIRGSMAAVGVGYQQMSQMCPPEIEIACHNSAESCTISGPADVMRTFVAELTSKGIFAKEVPCSNIAYHSRYIAEAGPGLLKYLKQVMPTPKARSERWVSTSVPQDRWNEPLAKYSSAEYHTNNLLSPVLFEETSRLIPASAVLVEVAPHGLLQAILKRSLPQSCTNIALTRRAHPDNVLLLLQAVGELYMKGYNPKVDVLYPQVEFPVSTGTPMLSHLVEWAHHEKWILPLYQTAHRTRESSRSVLLTLHQEEHKFLKGHVIREKTLVPFSFALVAAWDTLAMLMHKQKKSINVEFHDVTLYTQPIIYEQKVVRLVISVHKGTGWFEIMNENSKVATGYIKTNAAKTYNVKTQIIIEENDKKTKDYTFTAADVYRLFYERQFAYSGAFRSIHSADESLNNANILWEDNWVTFLEGLCQINTLKHTAFDGVSQLDRIGRLEINVEKHNESILENRCENSPLILKAQFLDVYNRTRCEGVTMENLQFRNLPPTNTSITMQTLKFVPRQSSDIDMTISLHIILQMAAENLNKDKINVVGITYDNNKNKLFEEIKNISLKKDSIPGIEVNYRTIARDIVKVQNDILFENVDLIVIKNLSNDDNICQNFHHKLRSNTFIVNEEDALEPHRVRPSSLYNVVSVLKNPNSRIELVMWRPTSPAKFASAFTVRSESDLPLLTSIRNKLSPDSGLIVVTSYPPVTGIVAQVKHWRRDSSRNRINVIMVNEDSNDNGNLDELPDVNLAFNIYHNGTWGGEYLLPVEENTPMVGNVALQSKRIGHLDSLRWVPAPEPSDTGILVTVHYAGINVGDTKRALGITNRNEHVNSYGMEFSGITSSGERVMGLVPKGALSSEVIAQPELLWPVPSYWSLEDAATVPFAYTYAYYCLVVKTSIKLKMSNHQYTVLVHGGAGALGQAVISVALAMGYKVFTTVSDRQKKQFLMRLYPELKDENICNSRDPNFADVILTATNGRGCDLVICCLKKEFKSLSYKCCGEYSILCDTAQILNHENYQLGMNYLTNDTSYITIDIASIINDTKSKDVQMLHRLVSEGIAVGEVRPLSRVTYSAREAPRAFRLLAASRHRGRVLLRLPDSCSTSSKRVPSGTGKTHLVICDDQPLGLQLTEALINSGHRKIHIHFVKVPSHLQYKLSTWNKLAVKMTISQGELNDLKNITNLFIEAANLGPVNGLYLASDCVIKPNILANLRSTIDQYCPSLKRFVNISNDYNSIIQKAKGLPAVVLDLSKLEKFQDEDGLTWYSGASEAIDRALLSSDSVLIAQPKSTSYNLVQEVAAVADLKINETTSNTASLEELGMISEKSPAVAAFLRNEHNTYLDEKTIPLLTLEKIKEIENKLTPTTLKEIKGLKTFYSYVDSDELLATTDTVFLPTLTNNSTTRDDEFDVNETFLCIVPGLEGHHRRFRTLCEHLKLPALVLQPDLDRPADSPRQLALRYAQVLIKKTGIEKKLNKPFYIAGYEVGVIVALELAAILEEYGLTGTVFCIGDGPDEVIDMLNEELRSFGSEEDLQAGVVRHMSALIAAGAVDPATALAAAGGDDSWEARVDASVRALLGRVPHSAQYARMLIEAAYSRINSARRHNASPRALRSQIVLIRAHRASMSGTLENCSLHQYSRRTLKVWDINAPIAHATADLRVPAIINFNLDADVLNAFEKKNLCDSYLLNADAFMSCT